MCAALGIECTRAFTEGMPLAIREKACGPDVKASRAALAELESAVGKGDPGAK